jgi:hypothetical protein
MKMVAALVCGFAALLGQSLRKRVNGVSWRKTKSGDIRPPQNEKPARVSISNKQREPISLHA